MLIQQSYERKLLVFGGQSSTMVMGLHVLYIKWNEVKKFKCRKSITHALHWLCLREAMGSNSQCQFPSQNRFLLCMAVIFTFTTHIPSLTQAVATLNHGRLR